MSSSMPRAAVALVASLVLAELVVIWRHPAVLLIVATALWFAWPGVLFVRAALGPGAPARAAAWCVGPALGFGFSVFGLLLLWAAGVPSWAALALAPLFTLATAWIARRAGGVDVRLPVMTRSDLTAAAAVLAIVPLVTLAPYANVRAAVPEGEAYRAYFTADFVWAMTVATELAKGDVPPANPFLHGEPMRYYWMSHLLSGVGYRAFAGLGAGSEQIVLVNGLLFGLAFIAFLYWLARAVGASAPWAAIAVAFGVLANSFEGADVTWAILSRGDPLEAVRTINIDAVTRWFYQGMAVDGLQRLLLYQPHHLTGYALALSSLWLAGAAARVYDVSVPLWTGILLGLAFLFSTFSAIIMGTAVALLFAWRLWQHRALRTALQCVVLGAAPLAVGVGVAQTLGYTDPAHGVLLEIGPNRVALHNWTLVLILSFGPLLPLGVAGLLRGRWVAQEGTAPAALVAAALVFYFFTDVPDMDGVWVGWRSGHMLLIAFTAIAGAALTRWWTRVPAFRLPLASLLVAAFAAAAPTVAIDVYNAQDIHLREWGAGFPWTLVITPAQREALDWVKHRTAPDALVQPEAQLRSPATWALIPAFAERRMAAGLPISMIPLRPYRVATETVRLGIFSAYSAEDAHTMARALSIDYVYVGDVEQESYPGVVELLDRRPDLFPPAFRNAEVTVYGVAAPKGSGW